MAAPKTVKTYDLNGTLKDFPITFEYLARKFVTVTLIGADRRELILNTDYRFSTPTQITTLRASGWGPADDYDLIEIRRVTSATDRLVDFADGSILRAFDLNTSQVQSLHIAEEARDLTADTIGVDNDGNLDARARRIVNVADPINDGDAVTLRYERDWASSTLNNKIASENSAIASEVSRQASLTQANASAASASASQTSRVASEVARDASLTYSNNSSASSTLASKWASELEDIVVSGGKFSAYHWSLKATAQAGIATTQAGNSSTSASASQTSRLASEAARDAAQTSETNAAGWAAGVNMPNAAGKALMVLRQNAGNTGLEYVAGMATIRAQMVATVGQSGGVPTGGIIESGSNANGSYIKYADGTLVCRYTTATYKSCTNAIGSLYQCTVLSFTFPIAFSGTPDVSPFATQSINAVCYPTIDGNPSQTGVGLVAMSPVNTGQTRLGYIAVGRWF